MAFVAHSKGENFEKEKFNRNILLIVLLFKYYNVCAWEYTLNEENIIC